MSTENEKGVRGGGGPVHTCICFLRTWGAGVRAERQWCGRDMPPAVWQGPGEPRDVFLKVASGPSPEIKDFLVTIYA